MNPSAAVNIQALIQVNYPGGSNAFIQDGGILFGFPDSEHYLIYGKDLSKEFCKKIRDGASTYGASVEFVGSINFQYQTIDERKMWVEELNDTLINFDIHRAIVSVGFCTIYIDLKKNSNSRAAQKLIQFLRDSDSIVRAHIKCSDSLVVIEQPCKRELKEEQSCKREPKKASRNKTEMQIERFVITDDDILNLKIDLENSRDVEEFINSL